MLPHTSLATDKTFKMQVETGVRTEVEIGNENENENEMLKRLVKPEKRNCCKS